MSAVLDAPASVTPAKPSRPSRRFGLLDPADLVIEQPARAWARHYNSRSIRPQDLLMALVDPSLPLGMARDWDVHKLLSAFGVDRSQLLDEIRTAQSYGPDASIT